ncbi:MAG: hypothetical protein LBJ01_10390 [Tannerella sp.]|jgi:hypothetical protein|nr:hypothetical protein [Tannerella sp.]
MKIKILWVALIVLSLTGGCTKDLDLSPRDTVSDDSFWKTVSDFEKAANALYAALPGFSNFDSGYYFYLCKFG